MKTTLDYSLSDGWTIAENAFDSRLLGKCEAILCLGNGYLGLRSATEETYSKEQRGLFVAGTFNKADEADVTELPNAADLIGMELGLNGELFRLDQGKIVHYLRTLDLKTGELVRDVHWISPAGNEIKLRFRRIVSLNRLHTIAQKVEITSLNRPLSVRLMTGINGRMTNSGAQHFSEGPKRFYEKKLMQSVQTTSQSKIDFVFSTGLKFFHGGKEWEVSPVISMPRRMITCEYRFSAAENETVTFEKISNVYTSRDREAEGLSLAALQKKSLECLKEDYGAGYETLAGESAQSWQEEVWSATPIVIESENAFDQLAARFMQYHLQIMVPAHDSRMSIAAKGLSGEGYKGHTFWDNDIFVLPYFTFTNPKVARSLETYRYLSLSGAHKKAAANGYQGAQYPWESAWLDDGEVTPVWGAADIVTGLPTKIWSGFLEQHITADVAYGIWQYDQVTDDRDFMDRYGYEIVLDTAKFWASRLEWSSKDKMYHINDVVGPNEYKEHVNDNAFTNYMAHWNISIAMEYCRKLKTNRPQLFAKLDKKIGLEAVYQEWEKKKDLIFLPRPREKDGVIGENATYLSLKEIDLSNYKKQSQVGSLFLDYNLEQVNQMQVTKQADVLILFILLENLFSPEIKKANWNYYEPRTLHDSSLSLSTHCILAMDLKDAALGYELFQRACRIDLGPNMESSDEGIHTASIGGIWQCIAFGFAGIRLVSGKLRINPSLPAEWKKLSFPIFWHGQKLLLTVTEKKLQIQNETNSEKTMITVQGKEYEIDGALEVALYTNESD